LRILIVTQYFWPEPFRINDLAVELRERGHAVAVLTGMPNYPGGRLYPGYGVFRPGRESWRGVTVLRVPLIPRGANRGWRLALNYLSFMFSASLLGPLRCRGGVDLVFVYEPSPVSVGIPGWWLGLLKKAPLMMWIQDLWPETLRAVGIRSRTALWAAAALSRFIHRRCDRILVQSKAFVAPLLSQGVAAPAIDYLPNWAEDFYRPLEKTAASADPIPQAAGFRVLFAGNIGGAQSFETVVDAASRLADFPDIHWIVIGDGHRREWLETELRRRRLESRFHLTGWQPAEKMPVYFSFADALLVTLRADPVFALTIPSKIQSYLACGKPLIGSLDGAGADVIKEAGAGIVGPAEDAAALADAVLAVYRMNPAQRAQLGNSGRAYYDAHFRRADLIRRIEERMRGMVDEHRRNHG